MQIGFFHAQRQNDAAEEDDVGLFKITGAHFGRANNIHQRKEHNRQKTRNGYGQSRRQPVYDNN